MLALLGATLVVALGASTAAAASKHPAAVRTISSCGYVATAPGTYELTKNLTDSGKSTCITFKADNSTLYLDGHTITCTGSDYCVTVENLGTSWGVNQTVIGGTKAKPTMPATLKNCSYGMWIFQTSGTTASNVNIDSPTSYGGFTEYAGGMMLSSINIPLHASAADGFYLEYGSDNVVTESTVDNNSASYSFYTENEVGDAFTYDTAKDSYSKGGNSGYGFYDYESSRDTYSHDTSTGNFYGFYLYGDAYGPVTATYDYASGPSTTGSYGFYVYEAYQEADYASRFHTNISHNKTDGFQYGYYDYSNSEYAVAE
jgi:hypothetical protein